MTGVPTFELSATVEVDELLALRGQLNDQLAEDGIRLSVTDLLVRASAVALSDHPEVNSAWGGDKVIRRGHVNIGVVAQGDRRRDRKSTRLNSSHVAN